MKKILSLMLALLLVVAPLSAKANYLLEEVTEYTFVEDDDDYYDEQDEDYDYEDLDDELIGYMLYKNNEDYINLDELQIISSHQGDKVTYIKLLKHLLPKNR